MNLTLTFGTEIFGRKKQRFFQTHDEFVTASLVTDSYLDLLKNKEKPPPLANPSIDTGFDPLNPTGIQPIEKPQLVDATACRFVRSLEPQIYHLGVNNYVVVELTDLNLTDTQREMVVEAQKDIPALSLEVAWAARSNEKYTGKMINGIEGPPPGTQLLKIPRYKLRLGRNHFYIVRMKGRRCVFDTLVNVLDIQRWIRHGSIPPESLNLEDVESDPVKEFLDLVQPA